MRRPNTLEYYDYNSGQWKQGIAINENRPPH